MKEPTSLYTSQAGSFITCLALILLAPVSLSAAAVQFSGSANNAAGLTGVVDSFRTAVSLGGANNGSGGVFTNGRREVNWDGGASDPFQFDASQPPPNPLNSPDDFFANNVRRGLFTSSPDGGGVYVSGRPGTLNGDGSANNDVRFNTANPTYDEQFQTFSNARLFAADGGIFMDITFGLPSDPTVPALVNGFGAVFVDVDLPGVTKAEYYGYGNILLGSFDVPTAPEGLSFFGATFTEGSIVERVRLILGNSPFEDVGITETPAIDVVVLDDFIYGEPQLAPVPEPSTYALFGAAGLGLLAILRRRRASAAPSQIAIASSPDPFM